MRNFSGGNKRFGGGRDFKRHDFGRGGSSDRFEKFRAVCSACGDDCELPFRPTGSKPVYCSKCFQSNRKEDERQYEKSYMNDRRGGNNEDKLVKQLESLNYKLDKIIKLLTPATPVETVKPPVSKQKKKKTEVAAVPEIAIEEPVKVE